jgi:hypothetical protein
MRKSLIYIVQKNLTSQGVGRCRPRGGVSAGHGSEPRGMQGAWARPSRPIGSRKKFLALWAILTTPTTERPRLQNGSFSPTASVWRSYRSFRSHYPRNAPCPQQRPHPHCADTCREGSPLNRPFAKPSPHQQRTCSGENDRDCRTSKGCQMRS